MESKFTYIDTGDNNQLTPTRYAGRKDWKMDLMKKGLFTLQHISPKITSEVIWYYFTQPGYPRFSKSQLELLEEADISTSNYNGHKVKRYVWGKDNPGPKVLLIHGWGSKTADFRRMILALVKEDFVVEGLDMTAHGHSEGKHSALPEFRDILKNHYVKNGPYEALLGYSLGGLAAGIMTSEISPVLQPKSLFIMASPPYARYFFHDVVRELGYSNEVYQQMCDLVEVNYHESIDYFDLRDKQELQKVNLHLIYDESDQTVPIAKGKDLLNAFPQAHFVHTRGLGHNKIISNTEVIHYICQQLKMSSVINN